MVSSFSFFLLHVHIIIHCIPKVSPTCTIFFLFCPILSWHSHIPRVPVYTFCFQNWAQRPQGKSGGGVRGEPKKSRYLQYQVYSQMATATRRSKAWKWQKVSFPFSLPTMHGIRRSHEEFFLFFLIQAIDAPCFAVGSVICRGASTVLPSTYSTLEHSTYNIQYI